MTKRLLGTKKIVGMYLLCTIFWLVTACDSKDEGDTSAKYVSDIKDNVVYENETKQESLHEDDEKDIVKKSEVIYSIDENGERVTNERFYDKKGNLIKTNQYLAYDEDGNCTKYYYEYEYDEKGNMIKDTTAGYNNAGILIHNTWTYYKYEFDNEGRVVQKSSKSSSSNAYCVTVSYEYDKNGNCILTEEYGGITTKNEYDVNNNCIKTTTTMILRDGSEMVRETLKTYNEKDFVMSSSYYENGELMNCSEYKYDESGNMIYRKEETPTNAKVVETRWDTDENVIEQINQYGDEISKLTCDYYYDKNGNVIKMNVYNGNNKLVRYVEYKYDTDGNKIEEVNYYDDQYDNKEKFEKSYHYTWQYENGNLIDYKEMRDEISGTRIKYAYYE